MTEKELYDILSQKLYPIIVEDEDIVDYVEGSELTEEEKKYFYTWLVCATICVLLNGTNDPIQKGLFNTCLEYLSTMEKGLTDLGFGEDIGDELRKILDENIKEWTDIIKKEISSATEKASTKGGKKLSRGKKPTADEAEESEAFSTFKLFIFFLSQAVGREEDVDELAEKYSGIEEGAFKTFVTLNVFYAYLHDVKAGKIKVPEGVLKNNLNEIIAITERSFGELTKEMEVDDADQFNEDIKELISDHYNEFIKKMYKYAIRGTSKK